MSSAYYETKGKMKGSARDIADMTEVLRGYMQGVKDAYFMNLNITEDAEGEVSFSADGPYGKFDGLNDVDVFREMAKAAPMASFEADVEGGDDYSQSELHCCLKDGVLSVEVNVNNSEDDDRAYLEYVLEKMPYEKFIGLYGIEPDSLAKDEYKDFVNDLIIDYGEEENGPFDVDYDDLADLLENYGAEITLDEETYDAVREQAAALGIAAEYDFREEHDCSVNETFVFDAMTGQEIR